MKSNRARNWVLANLPTLAPLAALLAVVILFTALAPGTFATTENLRNIATQSSILAILATALTYVVLLGEIDLSFAAVASVSGLTGSLFIAGMPLQMPFVGAVTFGSGSQVVAVVAALLLGGLFGAASGLLTARFGVPSFVGSLAMLLVAQGLSFYWAQGSSVPATTPIAESIAQGSVGPFPSIALFAGAVMLLSYIVLSRTRLGRYIYMAGDNRQAAILSGVATNRIVIYVFITAGVLSACAGLLNVGRLGSAQADTGLTLLLPVFAAVVLGGNSLFGGIGGVPQTLIGVLLYSVLQNGLDQSNLDVYLKPLVGGLILVAAIVLNVLLSRIATMSVVAAAPEVASKETDARPAALPVSSA